MAHSLLGDPLLRVRLPDETVEGFSLLQILHSLSQDNVLSFEALQPHQQQAWHSFLVQLAAMAVAREAGGSMPNSDEGWRDTLVGLAGGDEAAWHLVVADVSRPAFLQPPVPEGSLEDAGSKAYDVEEPPEQADAGKPPVDDKDPTLPVPPQRSLSRRCEIFWSRGSPASAGDSPALFVQARASAPSNA